MRRIRMSIDDPKTNMARQNMLYEQYLANEQKPANTRVISSLKKMDLSSPMIDRIVNARQGCGGCGK